MGILALISDLFTQSQVSAAAVRAGVPLEFALSVESLLAKAAQETPRLVILDLSHPGVDPAELVPRLRAINASAPIAAFGPHVHRERLAAAQAAGCDEVISRGQFRAEADEILRRYS
jgi:CheY-like chemotaxis protein